MKHILSPMRKAIEDYEMIQDGDKIAVALSGGKDSITMLKALKSLQYFYPKKFDLVAISVNPGFEFFDSEFLKRTCDEIEVPFVEEKYDISKIVFEDRKEKKDFSVAVLSVWVLFHLCAWFYAKVGTRADKGWYYAYSIISVMAPFSTFLLLGAAIGLLIKR